LRGSINATAEANPGDNGSTAAEVTFESGQPPRLVHPQMSVSIPLPTKATREPLSATATMTLVYPLTTGEVKETTLTRDLTLSVAGGDYYVYHNRYVEWERTRSVVETPIWAVLLVGSVLAGAGGVYLVREGGLEPQPTSGLSFVIRRLSGTQRLGADLFHLEKFRDVADAGQGVYVGRVVAQSPAGRAGLRTGDVLIELAGKPTNSPGVVNRLAKGRKRGESLQAVVLRDGQRVELLVKF
ncbi:MAG TPA: PDZ domain-containing protein, partial [Aggregatilineaceae bacterium]|nr:PDZ domain-containing protein [Aggregatilineaceae bacterium]